MKIGIFDSGLGGLFITRRLLKELPDYDYIYLGDTKRVPYGNRSNETVYQFLKEAVQYLFKKNCNLVIVACNTASASALRKIQKEYLPRNYPKRRVLGVIIPTVEKTLENKKIKRVGVLGTWGTVNSRTFVREFKKANKNISVFQQAAPLLVPIIESGELKWARPILEEYLRPLLQKKVNAVILGCTHYPVLKGMVSKIAGRNVAVISQDELLPGKLKDYLRRHPEIETKLTKKRKREFLVTDINPAFQKTAKSWYGKNLKLKSINLT